MNIDYLYKTLEITIPLLVAIVGLSIYVKSKLNEHEIRIITVNDELKEIKAYLTEELRIIKLEDKKTCQFHNEMVSQVITKDFFNAQMKNVENWLNRIENKIEAITIK